MFPLAELYPVLTEHYAEIPEVQQGIAKIAWNYCVGERIRKISEPVLLKDGILQVRVSHTQWQASLNSIKGEIITRMNKYLKKRMVNDIEIEVR